MADTKFMSFAEVTPVETDSVLVGNSTNGVRRAQLSNLKAAIGGIVDESIGINSYIKFANGLKLQWGHVNFENTSEAGYNLSTITFPISFATTDYTIVFGVSGGVNETAPNISCEEQTITGAKLVSYFAGQIQGVYASWFAIGY